MCVSLCLFLFRFRFWPFTPFRTFYRCFGALVALFFFFPACVFTVLQEGETPLLAAWASGQYAAVRLLLLKSNSDVFHFNKDGWGCVARAARSGHALVLVLDAMGAADERKVCWVF